MTKLSELEFKVEAQRPQTVEEFRIVSVFQWYLRSQAEELCKKVNQVLKEGKDEKD